MHPRGLKGTCGAGSIPAFLIVIFKTKKEKKMGMCSMGSTTSDAYDPIDDLIFSQRPKEKKNGNVTRTLRIVVTVRFLGRKTLHHLRQARFTVQRMG